MIEVELTTGVVLEAVRVIDAPVGGVTPPLGVPPPVVGGGAVGDSDLQPAKNTSSSARRANISFRCLKSIISAPKLLFPPHPARQEHPLHCTQKSTVIRVLPLTASPARVWPNTSRIRSIVTIERPVSGSRPPFCGSRAAKGAWFKAVASNARKVPRGCAPPLTVIREEMDRTKGAGTR